MKKIIFIGIAFSFVLFSCKTLNYAKEENKKEVKLPFEKKDYPDTDIEYYSIENAEGPILSILRSQVLTQAKNVLSQRISSKINGIADIELQSMNSNQKIQFKNKSQQIVNQSMTKVKLVDTKVFRQKQKDGDDYDFWAVYKIEIDDVVELVNQSDLGFSVDNDSFKRTALIKN
jgi:hypothetical protein